MDPEDPDPPGGATVENVATVDDAGEASTPVHRESLPSDAGEGDPPGYDAACEDSALGVAREEEDQPLPHSPGPRGSAFEAARDEEEEEEEEGPRAPHTPVHCVADPELDEEVEAEDGEMVGQGTFGTAPPEADAAHSVGGPSRSCVKSEATGVALEDWIDPATVDWSALSPKEAERMQRRLRKQEKRRRRQEKGRDGESERKKRKKDKERGREARPARSHTEVAASTHKGEEAAEAVKAESATLTLEPHDPPVGDAPASSLSIAEHWRGVMSSMKPRRPPPIPVAVLEERSHRLIEKMHEAYRQDQIALETGEPGVRKLQLLEEVRATMTKSYMLEPLMRRSDRGMSVLDCFANWLEPVRLSPQAKKQLPNLNIRTAILEILLKLPLQNDLGKVQKYDEAAWEGVGKEELQCTKIGGRVSWLASHPQETVQNKHTAEAIIERWSRLFFNNTRDYRKLAEADALRGHVREPLPDEEWKDPLRNLPPEQIYSTDPQTELQARAERYQRRLRLPQRQMMNFHYRPKSDLTPEDLERREKTTTPKERLMMMVKRHARELKDANRIGARATSMSIEGSLSTLPQGPS